MYKKLLMTLALAITGFCCLAQESEIVSKSYTVVLEDRATVLKKIEEANVELQKVWQQELELKKKDFLKEENKTENIVVDVSPEVKIEKSEDGGDEMNLNLGFSYETVVHDKDLTVIMNNIKTDDYPLGKYDLTASNACTMTLEFVRNKLDNELSAYFSKGQKVTIKITGATDGSPIRSAIPYFGEYGDFNNKLIYLNGQLHSMTVTKESGITQNSQLGFLRIQGVEQYLKTFVNVLQRTDNTFQIYAVENKEKGAQYRRISIEIIVHGAFNNQVEQEIAKKTDIPQVEAKDIISDVDVNIPETSESNENGIALIIANENYKNSEYVGNVPFANNDGKIFKEYCMKTLGIPERQIKFVEDATLNGFNDGVKWLARNAEAWEGNANVVVYYAGHGVPDVKTEKAYMVPVDGSPIDVEQLYSLEKLYNTLGTMPAKSVTVFLDACFSGTRRNGQMMVEGTRSVVIDVEEEVLKGNVIVFSAADGFQTAHSFRDKRHGLFTYYLLKSLQDSNGEITLDELFSKIKRGVMREASLNSYDQTPTVNMPSELEVLWKEFTLK